MARTEKIVDSAQLAQIAGDIRAQGKRIVHCHGVFDLLHIGHIRYFEQALKYGDVLLVTLTADVFVNKGPGRPVFTEQLRAEAIAALECVTYVSINRAASAEQAIRAIQPKFHVKGPDYANRRRSIGGNLSKEEAAVKEFGGELVFTEDIQFSSSKLINEFLNPLSDHLVSYIRELRALYSVDQLEEFLTKVEDLKVLVVGETIIDEYCFGEVMGKAGKEPVLVSRLSRTEKYAGGAIAIANHIAGFSKKVSFLSALGSIDSHEEFIRGSLSPAVAPHFVIQKDRPTILKRRFLETNPLQKLFEVYVMDDRPLMEAEDGEFCAALENMISDFDVVIVADYGHALITERAKKILIEKSKFLAVNTQVNAGNRGFHTISCYPAAHYISISESELRLNYRLKQGDLASMVSDLAQRTKAKLITITRGKNGVLVYEPPNKMVEAPAFDQPVVDRVGSGDAVLAVTSLLAAVKTPPDALAFFADIAGSMAVKIIGHSSFITRSQVSKSLNSLLK